MVLGARLCHHGVSFLKLFSGSGPSPRPLSFLPKNSLDQSSPSIEFSEIQLYLSYCFFLHDLFDPK